MAKIKLSEDVQPLTTFRNNSAAMLQKMKRSGQSLVLTVNGKPEAVMHSVEEYERLMDLAAAADFHEGIRQAEDDIRHGRTYPAKEVFEELRAKRKRAS
ncbi:type II toxin-antitoxin system Phd/YefM family antitoxin [Terriglobus saanensis]|uniref:Antitoxin n=1 Tax=Terriglobus saanensis (strain ATCC BAA-1853 / DSM 23119 / SP1PR4) TaxID=401053 RepID=E8V3P2_TERSS|nr:type II toxin-antitoxin system Phd/YefM family antitoxin [Terriglobus saanensis]ADV84729.1 prevent-host-death family protein [Terriglobus saanensis SP1PR4]